MAIAPRESALNGRTEANAERHPRTAREEEELLSQDERWLLVQRILASPGFRRADQLRKMLLYASRSAILRPDDPIREYQIACDVLGRRPDFDAGSDNIVRVQTVHLRRKLEHYFSAEGAEERILLTIPRGSYCALFEPMPRKAHAPPASDEPGTTDHPDGDGQPAHPASSMDAAERVLPTGRPSWTRREMVLLLSLCAALALAAVSIAVRSKQAAGAAPASAAAQNPFLAPLINNRKSISVVLPDTSLMIIQTLLGKDISVSEYLSGYPQDQLKSVADPALRQALAYVATKQSTSFSEALVGSNLVGRLARSGAAATLRYARDLHVRDLGDGNTVIIGSKRANPWASLFTERANFRFVQNKSDNLFHFVNVRPAPGEQAQYIPDYTNLGAVISYVDIELTPNLTESGLVLLINGSDVQATEAAARFMQDRDLPSQLKLFFARKDLRSYEIFLRGRHIEGEADDAFEVVAVRSNDR